MTDSGNSMRRPGHRRPFFLVLAMFAAPLLLAFAVYYGSNWRPGGTTNKGDLIAPAIPLPAVTLIQSDGGTTDARFLRGTWTLVYVGDGSCDDVCRSALIDMRNARLLLGKDTPRVSRVFMYDGDCCKADYFVKEQADLLMASIDSEAGKKLLELFPDYNGVNARAGRRIYIVDPLGNLMMSYAPGANPRSIYQDLKKLLNLSHIG